MRLPTSLLAFSLVGLCLAFTPGCAADTTTTDSADEELRGRSDADVKVAIERAAEGILYVSESDYPFQYVHADRLPGDTKTISQTLLRTRFASYVDEDEAADKPMKDLVAMTGSWAEWKKGYAASECTDPDAYPGPDDCAKMRVLNDALERNLRDVKVFYFGAHGDPGHVEGVAVSIFVVGRTPSGNYAGVRTLAIWT